jgi:predicted aspartyl protease
MVVDEGLARELGLTELPCLVEITLADKRRVTPRLFVGEVELKGRRGPTFVAASNVPVPLLGLFALESLGLKPNPQAGEVEVIGPEGGYLLAT